MKKYLVIIALVSAPIVSFGQAIIANPQNNSGEGGELVLKESNSTFNPWHLDNLNGNFRMFHSGKEYIRMNKSGYFGIGTGAPLGKFHVKGEAYVESGWLRVKGPNGLFFQDYGGGFRMADNTWIRTYGGKSFYHDKGTMRTDGRFEVGPVGDRFVVNSSGRVGIGNTSPKGSLHISSPITSKSSFASIDANLIVEGKSTSRSTEKGASLGFVVPANTDGSNHWQQGRILVTPDNNSNGNASGRMYLQARYLSDGKWQWRDNLVLNSLGNVGVGTASPEEKLHVKGTTTIDANIGEITAGSHWQTGKHTLELQTIGTGDVVLSFHRGGHSNAAIKHGKFGGLLINGSGGYGDKHLFVSSNGNIGMGTTKTNDNYKLSVNGNIRATEVKVYTGWADYVFKDDYQLPTLAEVAQHIQEKGHLINIPSEAEVAENGIQLGEMNAKLLEKIEELTLYTLEQEEKLKQLEVLEAKNTALEARLEKIELLLQEK